MARLLVIDDDPFVIESLKMGLGQRGHEVYAGHNGRDGVRLVNDLTPDLVIIDMTMPIMDGLEATEQIRQQSDVPIIMLTAETDEEDVVAALDTGVDEYVGKPFRLNELVARIQALIRRRDWANTKTEKTVAELKQNLMATMTHELRTPIASILNTLEVVFASAGKEDFQSQLRFLENVQKHTHDLNSLVEDLLILSQIDEGLEIFRRPFSLYDEIERLIDKHHPVLAERSLTVQNDVPAEAEINGDIHKLRHLLHHLFDNALKFSQAGKHIHIWAHVDQSGEVELTIADQGIGISSQHHAQIFERYFQIDQGDSRSYSGLGIGLTIAKAVAEAHDGHIRVRSEPNRGSQFILTLPVAEPDWTG